MLLFLNAQVARLSPEPTDNNLENYATINPNVLLDIQPASAELTAISEGKLGQTFRAFTTYSGFVVGDRITVSGTGDIYTVHGIDNWNYGPMPHLELVLFKGDR